MCTQIQSVLVLTKGMMVAAWTSSLCCLVECGKPARSDTNTHSITKHNITNLGTMLVSVYNACGLQCDSNTNSRIFGCRLLSLSTLSVLITVNHSICRLTLYRYDKVSLFDNLHRKSCLSLSQDPDPQNKFWVVLETIYSVYLHSQVRNRLQIVF